MAEGFDFDHLRQREEFPVMEALMERVDLEIGGLQEIVLANSGVPNVEATYAPMEDLLSGYEAATAVWRLDDGIQAFPYDLRTEALAVVPSHLLVEASAGEHADNPSPQAEQIRRDYAQQRLPSVRSVGYTGILNMRGRLSDMYYDVLDAADAARIDPTDLILDDEHFHALVRGETKPTQFIAMEVKAINAITPDVIIAERTERLRQELKPSGSIDADEKIALEHTLADTQRSMSVHYVAALETSALRHGHAVATLSRVKELWSPNVLRQVNPDVRELLDDALRSNFPFPQF